MSQVSLNILISDVDEFFENYNGIEEPSVDFKYQFHEEELLVYFEYLDELRQSGITNMYGATYYLISEYDLGPKEAEQVLHAWMKSYSGELSVKLRVKAVLDKEWD